MIVPHSRAQGGKLHDCATNWQKWYEGRSTWGGRERITTSPSCDNVGVRRRIRGGQTSLHGRYQSVVMPWDKRTNKSRGSMVRTQPGHFHWQISGNERQEEEGCRRPRSHGQQYKYEVLIPSASASHGWHVTCLQYWTWDANHMVWIQAGMDISRDIRKRDDDFVFCIYESWMVDMLSEGDQFCGDNR